MSNGRGYFKIITMKTALEELIDWCNSCLTDITISDGAKNAIEVTIVRATDLVEKEKQQIIDAHFEGWSDAYDYLKDDFSAPRQAEDYYNETYNNDN